MPTEETREVNQQPDTKEQFAADLRALRLEAGKPILTALAHTSGISKTSISDAFAGRKLPTENTIEYLVPALGGEVGPWLKRRAALDPRPVERLGARAGKRPQRRISMLAALSIAVAASLLSAGVTSVIWSTSFSQNASDSAHSPTTDGPTASKDYLPYEDGVDPMQTICREDSVIAASEERLDGEVLVQMLYSKKCMAVWGRVTRYDGNAAGNSMTMTLYPATDLESERNQVRDAFDVQSLYTWMIIEPDIDARVCGIASITNGDKTVELGPPLCV